MPQCPSVRNGHLLSWALLPLALQVEKPPGPFTYLQGSVGYPLGQVMRADVPVCEGLLNQVNAVLVSPQADALLLARGSVGGR
jgi:hypothetical protein